MTEGRIITNDTSFNLKWQIGHTYPHLTSQKGKKCTTYLFFFLFLIFIWFSVSFNDGSNYRSMSWRMVKSMCTVATLRITPPSTPTSSSACPGCWDQKSNLASLTQRLLHGIQRKSKFYLSRSWAHERGRWEYGQRDFWICLSIYLAFWFHTLTKSSFNQLLFQSFCPKACTETILFVLCYQELFCVLHSLGCWWKRD